MGYPLQTAEMVLAMLETLRGAGMDCRWSGLCIWIESQPTAAQAAQLQAVGAEYARKKSKWYIRANDGLKVAA